MIQSPARTDGVYGPSGFVMAANIEPCARISRGAWGRSRGVEVRPLTWAVMRTPRRDDSTPTLSPVSPVRHVRTPARPAHAGGPPVATPVPRPRRRRRARWLRGSVRRRRLGGVRHRWNSRNSRNRRNGYVPQATDGQGSGGTMPTDGFTVVQRYPSGQRLTPGEAQPVPCRLKRSPHAAHRCPPGLRGTRRAAVAVTPIPSQCTC